MCAVNLNFKTIFFPKIEAKKRMFKKSSTKSNNYLITKAELPMLKICFVFRERLYNQTKSVGSSIFFRKIKEKIRTHL